ncbi:ABC transporter substrate-binding protein [Xanthobacter tagetidis]|jgi:NitT/TauT family transport system substrate-binding protein|uniref:ABC transporter substrate-binding protein n=1 Tax=Xanthobacter tagetidis TaxID=60216 RepID=A0A3L7AK57_9HYPH|nr:ABC transporter substrate-binding protein [Xanthobacter tagetidis]MBB6309168.1 NitT/TauT family transport system substrate-binding protein [Xanthobacter tagetidis]RLP80355.1 ABC transporter substrate-binding protein [Xanthobacter tagetidis]
MSPTFRLKTLALAAAALAGLGLPAAAQTKITAGTAAFNEALLPIYTAKEKGYFKDAGIELEITAFKGGGPAVQALVSGSIDMCLCAADHVVRLKARRQPAQILVALDEFHSYALMAKASFPGKDYADLKGKKIGITSPGSLTDNTLRYSLTKAGISPEREVQIVGTGGGVPMMAAIDSGQVDAGLLITTDVAAMLEKAGAYRVVIDYREMPYASFGALVLKSWVEKNPAAAKAFTGAVVKAIADLKADPKLAETVLATMYPNFSPSLIAAVAKTAVARTPAGGVVSPDSIKNLNEIVLVSDDTLKPVTVEEVFDPKLGAK